MSVNDQSVEYIPRSASKASAWVKQLPIANFGETTRRLYIGLVDFNQSRVAPAARIEVINALQGVAKLVLWKLHKRLEGRAFPLQPRSQRIFELKQSLLLELAGSYQLAALDMLTTSTISKRNLLRAIYKAMDYMSQVLLQSYSVYTKTRETLWHDIHHLYLLACENNLQDVKAAKEKDQFSTITDIYKYVNLLALSSPYSLRQGEIDKLHNLFHAVLPLIQIHNNADNIRTQLTYVVHLNSDTHAALVPVSDILNSPTIRVLDLSELIKRLDSYIGAIENKDQPSDYYLFNGLNLSLAKRLVFHFTRVRNRSFSRTAKNENIQVVTGLTDVVTIINESYDVTNEESPNDDAYIFAALDQDVGIDGNIVKEETTDVIEKLPVNVQTWHVENSSIGGYGLCLRDKAPSGARVGEIIGLKPQSDQSQEWQVGTIRWLEYDKNRGLCAGIEFLAPHIAPVQAKQLINRKASQSFPVKGLALPMIEGIRPEPELVFPVQVFQSGDQIKVNIGSREETVCLTSRDECTGSFGIFGYAALDEEESVEQEDEDYSAIWGSL